MLEVKGRAMRELKMIVAQPFRIRGKTRLTRTEFIFALSLDLNWFTLEQSKEVLATALKEGLLKPEGDRLIPAFNTKVISVPPDFNPGKELPGRKSLIVRIIDLISSSGISESEAKQLIDDKVGSLYDLVTPEVAGLIVAKERGLDVDEYIDEAYRQLLQG